MEKRKKKCLLAVLLMVATVFAINVACANDELNSYPPLRIAAPVVPSGEVLDIAFEPLKYGYESNTLESIEIKNNTNEDLVVSGFDLENNDYFIMSTSTMFPMTVASGETKTVGSLSVTPGLYAGSYETNIIITDVNDNKYYGRVSVTVGGAEQPLKMQDQYMNTNSYIQIADLEKAVTGNKGKVTFALQPGGKGSFNVNNPEGYCKSSKEEGYAEMKVTAEAVDENGDGNPEWAETYRSFRIYVVEKAKVKISGFEDNCVFEYDRYPKTPSGEIKLEDNKVTVGGAEKVLQVSDLEVYYQGSGDTDYAQSSDLPMDAGTYSVTYKVPDDNVFFCGSATYTFEIKKVSLEKLLLDEDTFEYDGEQRIPTHPLAYNPNIMYWDGDTTATDAGEYTIFVSLIDKNNYEWDDGTTDDLSLNWRITPKKLDVPTVSGEYEYNYSTQRVVLNDFDEDTMTLLYGEGMNAGTYDVTIVLKDRRNYAWKDDESSNDKIIKWVIKAINPSYDIPQFLTGIEGEKLSSITFESGDDGVFSWNEPETILTAGTNNYKATYTPKNTNFNTITDVDVPVKVKGHFDVITSVNGGNGTISNSVFDVLEDTIVEVILTPNNGYEVSKVLINGTDYTSEVVDNKLELMPEDDINVVVSYRRISTGGGSSTTTYKITVTAPENATVAPKGTVKVKRDREQTFIIEAKKGYEIEDVLVDGKSVGAINEYTFKKVREHHTLEIKVKAIETNPEEKETFKDVKKNDWFYEAVNYVYGKKLMNGTGNDEFSPNISTTRGMIVTILYRLEGSPEVANSTFTDVASTEYYAKAVAWGEANGIVKGYGEGIFGPNDLITREQLAAIMYRYSNYKKYDTSVGEDTNILSYNDISELSEYAVPSMQWACGESLVSGIGNNLLAPRGNATRAQVATILMRYCEKYMK